MTDEAFLRALQEKPDDDTTRLIYADWLEEQADEQSRTRAEYIRLDCDLARVEAKPVKPRKRKRPRQVVPPSAEVIRRRDLAAKIDSDWLAVVSKAPIERCAFTYECPLKWENLEAVEDSETERFCSSCQQKVYFCSTLKLARSHAEEGHCVAVDARHTRRPGDLEPIQYVTMGLMLPPSEYQDIPEDEYDE